MWLPLSAATIALSILTVYPQTGSTSGGSTSIGPTSSEEQALLWNEGQAAHEKGNHAETVRLLQRLVDRYPSAPGYLDAHLLLGKSLLALGEAKAAVSPLKYFIQGSSNGSGPQADLADSARLQLVKAELALSKPREAYLLATEALARATRRKSQPLIVESLVAKGHSEIALNQDARARKALDSARAELKKMPNAPSLAMLEGKASILALSLKSRECARFPSAKRLEEDQVRDQLDRRGDCLLEAELMYKELLPVADEASSREGTALLAGAFEKYRSACGNPPDPVGKRTPSELKRYRAELAIVLGEDCGAKVRKAIEFAESWKKQLPAPSAVHLDELARKMRS